MKTPQRLINTLESAEPTIWTIGHSNRSQRIFLEMLKEHKIEILVDIRRFPTSKVEHFKKESMDARAREKWFKLVMYLKRIEKQKESKFSVAFEEASKTKDGIPAHAIARAQARAYAGSYEPFDYIAFPRRYMFHYDEMVLVEVKTGTSRLTKLQRKIANYAKGLGIKVLILRVDGQAPKIFCKLADQLVSVEEF